MRLHEAWIADSVVGRANTDIAPGLLHDNAEDCSDINAGLGSYGFDRVLDECDLVVAVVEFNESGVGLPEGGVGCPLVLRREVGGGAGVLHVIAAGLINGCTW